jgi:hypothetical protein
MSGGIDWFRWHHGTVTDQKFPLIAKRSGASVAEVIAVWACLLEAASMNEKCRGLLEAPDFEAMDCALGMPDGRAQAIFDAMQARDIVDQHLHVSAWNKRQPKREREDDSSTDRVRAFRERQRHETPSAATERTETPREEKSREEEKTSPSLRSGEKRGKRAPAVDTVEAETLVEAGFDRQAADDFIAHKRRVKAPLTPRAWADHQREAAAAGWSVQAAADKVMARNWKGFCAAYVEREHPPPARGAPESFRERDARIASERVAEATGGLLGTRTKPTLEVIECLSQTHALLAGAKSTA